MLAEICRDRWTEIFFLKEDRPDRTIRGCLLSNLGPRPAATRQILKLPMSISGLRFISGNFR